MIRSNKPVSPIMTKRRLNENPVNKMNNMGLQTMFKIHGDHSHLNRVKDNTMKVRTGSSYGKLFKF